MSSFKVLGSRSIRKPVIEQDMIKVPIGSGTTTFKENLDPIACGNTELCTDELRDLLDVASLVNYADRYCTRGSRERWCRDIEIELSLRSPDKFLQIKDKLELCLNILGGDNITFVTYPIGDGDRDHFPKYKPRSKSSKEKIDSITDIVLMSGGQDSSIAAETYLKKGKTPFFVRINTHDKANPRSVLKSANHNRVRYFYHNQNFSNIDGKKYNTQSVSKETSQRLRSFYFLTIATAIAATTRNNKIHINENGIMGFHLPLDVSRSSTFSTRTAYPPYLKCFSSIISQWLQIDDFEVENMWILKTKKEVIEMGISSEITNVICESISCAHSAKVQNTAKIHKAKSSYLLSDGRDLHCGYCFPCILRKISMTMAGLEQQDVSYLMNPFGGMIVDAEIKNYSCLQESKSAILSLIRFTKFFIQANDVDILIKYPQIYECAVALGDINNTNQIIALHRRFAQEVFEYINNHSPLLIFLFDDAKSAKIDKIINSIASFETMEKILSRMSIGNWNEQFEKQLIEAYSLVRFRVLIALGNDLITEGQLIAFFERTLRLFIPRETKERESISLNNNDGRDVKNRILADCSCPPFTGRP